MVAVIWNPVESEILFGLLLIALPALIVVVYMLWAMDDEGLKLTINPAKRRREKLARHARKEAESQTRD